MIQERLNFLNQFHLHLREFKNHFEPLEQNYFFSDITVSRTLKYSLCKDEDILCCVKDLLKEINYLLVPLDTIVPILFTEYISESMVGNSENPVIEYKHFQLSNGFYLGAFYSKKLDILRLSIEFNVIKDI